MSYNLKCGAGKAIITPPIGTSLYGYPGGRPAGCVGDDLEAIAILVTSNEDNALLITCTICSMNPELAYDLRKIAADEAGINPQNVTICCTHTHSGPNVSIKSGWGDVDYEYIEKILKPGIREASQKAKSSLKPAKMGIGETDSDVSINRRETNEQGKVVLGFRPWGVRDPKMTVISFVDYEGAGIANIIHYGCHGTAAGGGPEISRDWSGVMTDMLELESGAITGFYNGFEGDQAPNIQNRLKLPNYKRAIWLGGKAGIDAVRAWKSIKEYKDVPVKVYHDEIKIPFEPLASKEEAESNLSELGTIEQIYAEKRFADVNAYIHWNNVLAEYEPGKQQKTHFKFNQDITTIGPVAILPAPFEVFAEIGLRIRALSPYPYTLNLCNTHGAYAYLPTKTEIAAGGYEVWHFLLGLRTTYPLPQNTDDYWVQENIRILRQNYNN